MRWLTKGRRAWGFAAIAFAVTAALGLVVDQTNVRVEQAEERDLVRAALRPYADNLAAAVGRRVAQVSGVRAFVQSRRDFETLAREFNAFGEGLTGAGGSLRAVELVRDDRIVLIYPLAGNEAALDLDLRHDPRTEVRRDFFRASRDGQHRAQRSPSAQAGRHGPHHTPTGEVEVLTQWRSGSARR